ncbi:MAG: (2Fe-2S) ferredoxin domain-containing protein [Magnetococcales bacterium]|nr:(2Fe-2S) ferredoxin domain-containing protein [Magnetococcales bacterium]
MKPERHVFVCMNSRPPGHPKGSCQTQGAGPVIEAFAGEMEKRGLWGRVALTTTGCMGPCDQGPTVVVYPEGVWYGKVKPEDVGEIFDQHLEAGNPVERLRIM